MKKLKLVMIGNGMAGVRTLEELLKLSSDLYDITNLIFFMSFSAMARPITRKQKKASPLVI